MEHGTMEKRGTLSEQKQTNKQTNKQRARAFSEIGKFFGSTKIFVSMPPPKKEIFQKGINMCHLFSLFFFFFLNQSSMSFLRHC